MSTVPVKTSPTDLGDYLKVAACTAVILQSVLALALKTPLAPVDQWGIGLAYNGVKFTAPAFIFGILYTTTRLSTPSKLSDYPAYLKRQYSALGVPTVLWTCVYLEIFPQVQVGRPFSDFRSWLWQFINGNAAPHLWYNTMMLQFILLMPLFWWLARWVTDRPDRIRTVMLVTIIGYALWIVFYDLTVWHGPQQRHWYLLDRLALSFGLYGVFGTLTAIRVPTILKWKRHVRWGLWGGFGLTFSWTGWQLFRHGLPVRLTNAPYYQLSMVLYDLVVIGLIAGFAGHQITDHARSLPVIHWLATYAYRAYLANVCWLQLVWHVTGPLLRHAPALIIIVSYGLTWLLAFGSAYGLHQVARGLHWAVTDLKKRRTR